LTAGKGSKDGFTDAENNGFLRLTNSSRNHFKIDINKFCSRTAVPESLDPSVTNDRYLSYNNFDVGLLYRNKGFYLSF
jgi:hypothetical protein